jgi:predicted transcriptional regulator of viral defense system
LTNAEMIMKIARENNGIITSAQITSSNISREYLRQLVEKGLLEKSERGIYLIPSSFEDEMFSLQVRFKRGIFSHETALFLMDLTDRTPVRFSMTFPLGYNTTRLKSENIRFYRVNEKLYETGIITVTSPGGNSVRIYNAERTLCDILKGRSHTDIQIVSDAFKRYARQIKKDIPLLSEYGRLFRVEKKLRSYLEVLL